MFDLVDLDSQTLGGIPVSLPAGTINVPGMIAWEALAEMPVTEGMVYAWVYIPSDSNRASVTGTVVICHAGDQEVTAYEDEQGTMTITAADATGYQMIH